MVGFFASAVTASLAAFAAAAPSGIAKRQNIDTTVLQFALTLEHLENEFYRGAIAQFSLADFQAAGYSANYYNSLKYIGFDEAQHVVSLQDALRAAGEEPVQPCEYTFPYTDIPSFITLSSVLEGVGTSAYLGGAPLITSKDYLTVAGSILAVEALHTSLQRTAIGAIPNANPFYTPLDPTSVFTLASAFIVSCPDSNAPLPFEPFPALSVVGEFGACEQPICGDPSRYIKRDHKDSPEPADPADCRPPSEGQKVTFSAMMKIPKGSFLTFVSGLTVTSVPGSISGKQISAAIPEGIAGQSYVFVTKSDVEGTFDDSQVIAGPAILEVAPLPVDY